MKLPLFSTYYEWLPSDHPTAPTLVLIHGLMTDSTIWDKVIPYLRKNYHVLCYDLLGHGQTVTSLLPEELSWDNLIDQLHDLLHTTKIDRIHVLGHGFGATLALLYAKSYPNAMLTLTILSLHITAFYTIHEESNAMLQSLIIDNDMVSISAKLASLLVSSPTDAWLQQVQRMSKNIHAKTFIHLLQVIADTNTISLIQNAPFPIYLLFGQLDPLCPSPARTLLVANELQDRPSYLFAGASNCLQIEFPELVAHQVHHFITHKISTKPDYPHELIDFIAKVSQPIARSSKTDYDIAIYCLSGFTVIVNQEEVSRGWNQRYAKEILFLLALRGNVTRDHLIELFWEEDRQGKNQLRVALSHLRKLLQDHHDQQNVLISDHQHIRLQGNIYCDAIELKKMIDRAGSLQHLDRANAIEQFFSLLTDSPLSLGINHESMLYFGYHIESKLHEHFEWCIDYYLKKGAKQKAQHLHRLVSQMLPGFYFETFME